MSVTFTPTAATWTGFSYYNDDQLTICDDGKSNEIVRFAHEEPSINYCNSRAAELLTTLDFGSRIIHEDGTREAVLYGRIPAHRCKPLLASLDLLPCSFYEKFNLHIFSNVLKHAIFHNCDITFG